MSHNKPMRQPRKKQNSQGENSEILLVHPDESLLGDDWRHTPLVCPAHSKIEPGQMVRMFKLSLAERRFGELAFKKELQGGEF